jgi:hypothetical protein
MKTTTSNLIRWAGLSAVVGGTLFVAMQPIHPPEILAAVTTPTWAIVLSATAWCRPSCWQWGRAEVLGYDAETVPATVGWLETTSTGFDVVLDSRRTVPARRILMATGLTGQLPEAPGACCDQRRPRGRGRRTRHVRVCSGDCRHRDIGRSGGEQAGGGVWTVAGFDPDSPVSSAVP